jgi:hypothetical protein
MARTSDWPKATRLKVTSSSGVSTTAGFGEVSTFRSTAMSHLVLRIDASSDASESGGADADVAEYPP